MAKERHATLYREYRPKAFAEVRGQEQVTTTLEKAIENGKIAHAYLFAGSRGTGKTSVARILARENARPSSIVRRLRPRAKSFLST